MSHTNEEIFCTEVFIAGKLSEEFGNTTGRE